jgi:hypothetical protein
MKKPLLITIIILVLVLAYPLVHFIGWSFIEKKPIEIVVLDKTVPTLDRLNHKSLMWVLTNGRFVKKDNKVSYSYKKDYYGFAPTRPLNKRGSTKKEYHLNDMTELPEKTDALYFADTYGVFFNDWYTGINRSRRSRKIYGGLNNTDYLLINEMKNRNKLIILEYNSFDFPTPEFESFRTQEKLGISATGWTGKYFEKLDSTSQGFPIWLTSMYRKQYKQPWTFRKPGIVFLSEKSMIVLEEGTQLKNALPHIITNDQNSKEFGVAPSVAFDKWFDIIDPLTSNVISKFRIETTSMGDTMLAANSLTKEFPAVVQDPVGKRTYYFAGDFSANKVCNMTSKLKGINKLRGILYSSRPDDKRRFFWLYYKPLVDGIFNNYYNSMKAK